MKKIYFLIAQIITVVAMENSNESIIPYDDQQHRVFIKKLITAEAKSLTHTICANSRGKLLELLDHHEFSTAIKQVNRKPVGLIVWQETDAKICGFNVSRFFGRQALIHMIVVDSDQRGNGYGAELLQFATDHLKPTVRKISLLANNAKMDTLCQRVGFSIISVHETRRIYQMNGEQ